MKLAGRTLAEVERVLSRLGLREREILQLYVETKNQTQIDAFAVTPYDKRVLLLPQCLRSQECPAKLSQFGYICERCGKCLISGVISEAERLGYHVFVLPGGTMIQKILQQYRPRACLGVACLKEIVMGGFLSERSQIALIGVPLLRDGCVNTSVNWDEVKEKINLSADPRRVF